MNREEAIKALLRIKSEAFNEFIGEEPDYEAFDMAIEALKAQEKPIICPRCGRVFATEEGREAAEALKAQEWIPCSDRLPEAEYGESDTVLVTKCWKEDKETCFVETAMFDGGNWCEPTGERLTVTKVLAWKPLPESYREEQNNDSSNMDNSNM